MCQFISALCLTTEACGLVSQRVCGRSRIPSEKSAPAVGWLGMSFSNGSSQKDIRRAGAWVGLSICPGASYHRAGWEPIGVCARVCPAHRLTARSQGQHYAEGAEVRAFAQIEKARQMSSCRVGQAWNGNRGRGLPFATLRSTTVFRTLMISPCSLLPVHCLGRVHRSCLCQTESPPGRGRQGRLGELLKCLETFV